MGLCKMAAGQSVFFRINVGAEKVVGLLGKLREVFYLLDFVLDLTVDFHCFAFNFRGSNNGNGSVKVKRVGADKCFIQLP